MAIIPITIIIISGFIILLILMKYAIKDDDDY